MCFRSARLRPCGYEYASTCTMGMGAYSRGEAFAMLAAVLYNMRWHRPLKLLSGSAVSPTTTTRQCT